VSARRVSGTKQARNLVIIARSDAWGWLVRTGESEETS